MNYFYELPIILPPSFALYSAVSVEGDIKLDDIKQQQGISLARESRRARAFFIRSFLILCLGISIVLIIYSDQFLMLLDVIQAHIQLLNWEPIGVWKPFLILFAFIVISLLMTVILLPINWYIGVVLPRRYGLKTGTGRDWLSTQMKLLMAFFVPTYLLVEVVTLLMVVTPQTWWIWAELVFLGYIVLKARFGVSWMIPSLNRIEPMSDPEIVQKLQALLVRLHMPSCRILLARISHKTYRTNAYVMGWGAGRCIILTDTMVQQFPLDEIEVILAHELGHLAHYDLWKRQALRGLMMLAAFYIIYLVQNIAVIENDISVITLPGLYGLIILIFIFIGFLQRFTRSLRRKEEYQADEFALRTTNNIQAFRNAMTRLTNINLSFAVTKRSVGTHPTLLERLQHADEFAARSTQALPKKELTL